MSTFVVTIPGETPEPYRVTEALTGSAAYDPSAVRVDTAEQAMAPEYVIQRRAPGGGPWADYTEGYPTQEEADGFLAYIQAHGNPAYAWRTIKRTTYHHDEEI